VNLFLVIQWFLNFRIIFRGQKQTIEVENSKENIDRALNYKIVLVSSCYNFRGHKTPCKHRQYVYNIDVINAYER